jgi:hypothetical protein
VLLPAQDAFLKNFEAPSRQHYRPPKGGCCRSESYLGVLGRRQAAAALDLQTKPLAIKMQHHLRVPSNRRYFGAELDPARSIAAPAMQLSP